MRLHVCAGWSKPLLVAHTILLEISCRGSYIAIVWRFCVGALFCHVALGVLSSLVIILLRKRVLVALLCFANVFCVSSSCCRGFVCSL